MSIVSRLFSVFVASRAVPTQAQIQQPLFQHEAFVDRWKSLLGSSRVAASVVLFSMTAAGSGCQMAGYGYNAQGVRLYQQGQYQAAMQQFQQALTTDPTSADAYYNMAATMHKMGTMRSDKEMLSQAETLYNQCLDIEENHTDCHRALAVLLVETGRSDRAFALLKNWATAHPELVDARVELARMYEEFGDRETAQVQLQTALQIDPQDARAWTALGHLREQAGDYSQALANYQRSYSLDTFQPEVAQRIASLSSSVRGSFDAGTAPGGGTITVQAPTATRY